MLKILLAANWRNTAAMCSAMFENLVANCSIMTGSTLTSLERHNGILLESQCLLAKRRKQQNLDKQPSQEEVSLSRVSARNLRSNVGNHLVPTLCVSRRTVYCT